MSKLIDCMAAGHSARAVASAFLDLIEENHYAKFYERHPLTGDFIFEAKVSNPIKMVVPVSADHPWSPDHKAKDKETRDYLEHLMLNNGRVQVHHEDGTVKDAHLKQAHVMGHIKKNDPKLYKQIYEDPNKGADKEIVGVSHHPEKEGKFKVFYKRDRKEWKREAEGDDPQVRKYSTNMKGKIHDPIKHVKITKPGAATVKYASGKEEGHPLHSKVVQDWAQENDAHISDHHVEKIEAHPTDPDKAIIHYSRHANDGGLGVGQKREATIGKDFQLARLLDNGHKIKGHGDRELEKLWADRSAEFEKAKSAAKPTKAPLTAASGTDDDEPKIVYPSKPSLVKSGAKEKLAALAGKKSAPDHDKVHQQIADLAKAHLEATKKLEAEREAHRQEREAHLKTKDDSAKLLGAAAKKLEAPKAAATKGHAGSLLQRLKGHIKKMFGMDDDSIKARKKAEAGKKLQREREKEEYGDRMARNFSLNPAGIPPRHSK